MVGLAISSSSSATLMAAACSVGSATVVRAGRAWRGTARGTKSTRSAVHATVRLARYEVRGTKHACGYPTLTTACPRMEARGDGITTISTAEIRRLRQEIELLYLTRETP